MLSWLCTTELSHSALFIWLCTFELGYSLPRLCTIELEPCLPYWPGYALLNLATVNRIGLAKHYWTWPLLTVLGLAMYYLTWLLLTVLNWLCIKLSQCWTYWPDDCTTDLIFYITRIFWHKDKRFKGAPNSLEPVHHLWRSNHQYGKHVCLIRESNSHIWTYIRFYTRQITMHRCVCITDYIM